MAPVMSGYDAVRFAVKTGISVVSTENPLVPAVYRSCGVPLSVLLKYVAPLAPGVGAELHPPIARAVSETDNVVAG